MKQSLKNVRVGDLILAVVVERASARDLIVSFDGDLLRINNQTGQTFRLGDQVELVVVTVRPLSFQLSPNSTKVQRVFERRV
jgi:hypothetical protein